MNKRVLSHRARPPVILNEGDSEPQGQDNSKGDKAGMHDTSENPSTPLRSDLLNGTDKKVVSPDGVHSTRAAVLWSGDDHVQRACASSLTRRA